MRLREARDRLREGLGTLPEITRRLEEAAPVAVAEAAPQWSLALHHEEPPGVAIRHHLPLGPAEKPTAPRLADIVAEAAQAPLSQVLEPLGLDALTVADDETFLDRLDRQRNLPDYLKAGLPALS